MACIICGARDIQLFSVGHFVERECPECGYYGVPKQVVEEMLLRKQRFDIGRTRAYLAMRVQNKESPWITPVDINNHQLLDASLVRT
jgi:hypothetical protein